MDRETYVRHNVDKLEAFHRVEQHGEDRVIIHKWRCEKCQQWNDQELKVPSSHKGEVRLACQGCGETVSTEL